jgi:hypothetical protein
MANDREVLREIWEGRLPVCFQLNSEEVYSPQTPDAYYLMVPRLSYFPLVTDKVRETHQNFIFAKHELECCFVILKYDHPEFHDYSYENVNICLCDRLRKLQSCFM